MQDACSCLAAEVQSLSNSSQLPMLRDLHAIFEPGDVPAL